MVNSRAIEESPSAAKQTNEQEERERPKGVENCNFTWKLVETGISATLGHRGCCRGRQREERRDKRACSGKERSEYKRGRVTVLRMRATPGEEGNAGKMERGVAGTGRVRGREGGKE